MLYSSGTTGLPKAIVQSQGGILVEHLKQLGLHCDLGPEDRFFWYTSTGWMMWNFLVSGLLTGTTIVLYDGSPGYPDTGAQWRIAERTGATLFGTSAAYVMACRKAGVHPPRTSTSRVCGASRRPARPCRPTASAGCTTRSATICGSPPSAVARTCAPASRERCRRSRCTSGNSRPRSRHRPPVLGPRRQALIDEVGELVVTNPMPSMPIRFWNDPDGSRYHDSYFDTYPGVWRHGDWITVTSRGSVVIHGRSDSTLNRQGVRMGSADIYEAVERLPEIKESLVIGVEQPDGGYWMPSSSTSPPAPRSTRPS